MIQPKSSRQNILVVADDFGLHPDINRGIMECASNGCLSAVSISVVGRAVDLDMIRALSAMGVGTGLHLTLVGEKWLTGPEFFGSWKELIKALIFSPRLCSRIEAELSTQIRWLLDHEIKLSHINSHQHVHAFPGIWSAVIEAAKKHGARHVRVPVTPSWRTGRLALGGLGLYCLSRFRARSLASESLPCLGISRSGWNSIDQIGRELQLLEGRSAELVTHPGVNSPSLQTQYASWNYDWDRERQMVLDLPDLLKIHGYQIGRLASSTL